MAPSYSCHRCERVFASPQALEQHKTDTGHNHMKDCPYCSRTFGSQHALDQHLESTVPRTCTACPQKFCKVGDYREHIVVHPMGCGLCRARYATNEALQQHISTEHAFCEPCNKRFVTKKGYEQHLNTASAHIDQFHCCECDRDFQSLIGLESHLASKRHAQITAATHKPVLENFCTDCNKQFHSADAYDKHRNSLVHKPLSTDLKCLFCSKPFSAPSALVMHLESSGCTASGLTRSKIDEAIFQHDTEGIICEGTVRPQLGTVVAEEDNDVESVFSEEGGVVFTPSSNGALTPTSGILTSTSSFFLPRSALSCPFCAPDKPPFMNARALEQHLASAAHAVKIYHCPTALLGLSGGRRAKFSTLSGLTQHLEAGACGKNKKQGERMFKEAIKFVEGKMREMGLGEMALIG